MIWRTGLDNLARASRLVFGQPGNWFLALAVAVLVFLSGYLGPNLGWLNYLLRHRILALTDLAPLTIGLIQSHWAVSPLTVILSAGLSALIGINFVLLVFYWRRGLKSRLAVGSNFLAGILGLMSFSCLSCGSAILSGLLGTVLAARFLSAIPGQQLGLGFISLGLLVSASFLLSAKIGAGCRLDSGSTNE